MSVLHTNADWREPFYFAVVDETQPDDLTEVTEAEIAMLLRDVEDAVPFLLTFANTRLLKPQSDLLQTNVPKATMATLPPGTYDCQLRLFWSDGFVESVCDFIRTVKTGIGA